MQKVVLATGNAGKVRELASLLSDFGLDIVAQTDLGVDSAEETGLTFIENAILKARHAAKVTGLPEMQRKGMGHNLNMRAAAMKYAKEHNKPYSDISVIVAHLGGGITLSLHHKGQIVDMISDDEGPFSPERAGGLPAFQVIDMATREGMGKKAMMKKVKTQGGLMGYFGVNDTRIVEKMMMDGDEKAKLIYDAMILNVARNIAKLSVYVDGKVDNIILTGGIAYSEYFTKEVAKRVEFIAPVIVYAGENEMESLALGALRVQRGEEEARTFTKVVPE